MADHTPFLLGWLITGVICGAIGALLGRGKGTAGAGFFYGFLLGPLGILLMAIARDERIQCPVCRELIHPSATVCPKCLSNMLDLRVSAAPQQQPLKNLPAAKLKLPKVIPKTPHIVAKTPRVVATATSAVAKATQALTKISQVLGKAPGFLIRKPLKVIRIAPPGVIPEPPKEIPKGHRIVAPGPPKEIPKVPRAVEKAPRFFVYESEGVVLGPYELAQIRAMINTGALTGQAQFCREGENEWKQSPDV